MRFLRTSLLTVAVLAMSSTPALAASANPAAKLSVASSPASARVGAKQGKTKLAGGFLIAAIAVVAVVAGIVIVATSDDGADSN